MEIREQITLQTPILRDYQERFLYALEVKKYRRLIMLAARGCGKDILGWTVAIRAALQKPGLFLYALPTYKQARRVIWEGLMLDGRPFIDFIPKQLILKKNDQEMSIILTNNSVIRCIGSNQFDSLRGLNPLGYIASEAAWHDERAYSVVRPRLTLSGGFALFLTTPHGDTPFKDMYEVALNNPDEFFVRKYTIDDTKHITREQVEEEMRVDPCMTPAFVQQEYYCDFKFGQEGPIYGSFMDKMELEGRIGTILWDQRYPVHTAWDIGVGDNNVVVFFQCIGNAIHIIDCYGKTGMGLQHYIDVIKSKPYNAFYGKHIAPFDIVNRDYTSGASAVSRIAIARLLGLEFTIAPRPSEVSRHDGIECVKFNINRFFIDEIRCAQLLKALRHYQRKYDLEKKRFYDEPLHDWSSDFCFVGETLITTDNGKIAIKDIKEGMQVRTPFGYKKVLKVHKKEAKDFLSIKVGNIELICTPEHNIFTQRGLVSAGTLRYNDVLDNDNVISRYLWQKIYLFYGKISDLNGFKKIYLSLKMDHKQSLMDIFIGGMDFTMLHLKQKKDGIQTSTGICGNHTMVQFLKIPIFITLMEMVEIIKLKILNVFQENIILKYIKMNLIPGHSLMHASNFCDLRMLKQPSGIGAKREENGTKTMQKEVCPHLKEQDIKKFVMFVPKNSLENKFGKNIVLMSVKRVTELIIRKILFGALAVCVKLHSFVINTLLKKHAVKSVQLIHKKQQEFAYDLTIEQDNCYYANGYLVSNCDAVRYMSISLDLVGETDMTAEELDKRYNKVRYGNQFGPNSVFNNNNFRR